MSSWKLKLTTTACRQMETTKIILALIGLNTMIDWLKGAVNMVEFVYYVGPVGTLPYICR